MLKELNNYLWPTIVSVAFLVHYLSSGLNAFKEVQDSALEDYASKAGITFINRATLEKYINEHEKDNKYKIEVPFKARNIYISKFVAFSIFSSLIFVAAIIQTRNILEEKNEQKKDEFIQIAKSHHNVSLENFINNNYESSNIAANHMLIACICFAVLAILFITLLFIAYKYLRPTEKISGINSRFLKRCYEWMPYADEFAFVVVICEFVLFWVEKIK